MLNRKTVPEITDAVKFQLNLPPHQKISLRNDVEVYLVNMGTVDTLMMNIVFYAGNYYEKQNLIAPCYEFHAQKRNPYKERLSDQRFF